MAASRSPKSLVRTHSMTTSGNNLDKPVPDPPRPKLQLSRMALIWLLLAIPFMVIIRAGRVDADSISYTEFSEQLKAGNVLLVEINTGDNSVVGTLRQTIRSGDIDITTFTTRLPLTDPVSIVERLERQSVTITAKAPRPGWISMLLSSLPFLLLIGFWVVLMRRQQGLGAQALGFGKSKARPATSEGPLVTFDDVAGADEAKEELQEIIDFLQDPQRFQRLGGRLPKGVLLVGPPGTGKTLLAKAVAGESGRPFFTMSGSDFVEMFVGVGAARVRDLFQQGKQNAPCIIFIDELDAVGRQRGAGLGGGHDEREQTLNQLLVELDGFETDAGVILLAATNRPDVLDPALLRPGRFDRQVMVELPDIKARAQILAVHVRRVRLAPGVDLAQVARDTPGLSGADLANLVNEAALLAARGAKDNVSMKEFSDARDKVMFGTERRSLVISEEERRLTAYHEAGHTLVNVLIPGLDPVQKVTIVPRGRALGLTFSQPEADRHSLTRQYLEGRLAVAYGGRIAEEEVFGPDQVTTGAAQDFQQATDLARRMVTEFGMSDAVGPLAIAGDTGDVFLGRELTRHQTQSEHTARVVDQEIKALSLAAYGRARQLVQSHRDTLDELAAALLHRETLNQGEILSIVHPTPSNHPAESVAHSA
jgi:cell division protease FtsH